MEMQLEKISEEHLENLKQYDALEIGAHNGGTTAYLSKLFKRVFAIDPWDGRQQGNQQVFEEYLETTKDCDNIIHCRTGSETGEARKFLAGIENLQLGFCFIDGLHQTGAVMNDFTLTKDYMIEGGIIMVDDTDYGPVNEGANWVKGNEGFEEIFSSYLVVNTLIGRKWDENVMTNNQIWVRNFIKK